VGIIAKQSIGNAIVSYIGIVVGFVLTVYLFPNILEADQFGLTRTMIAIMAIGSTLVSLGIPGAIIKYHPLLSKSTKNPKGLFITFLIPVLFAFVFFATAFILLKDFVLKFYTETPLMPEFYLYLIPLVLFAICYEIIKRYVNAQFDTVFASFTEEILLRLVLIVFLAFYFFDLISFSTFIFLFVANYGLQFLILFIYAFSNGYLNFSVSPDIFTKNLFKEVGTYSLYTLLGGVTVMIVGHIDMLMISSMIGLSETGIYSIAFYVGSVIAIPSRAISKIALPLISEEFENNNLNEIGKIYKQTSLNQYLFGLLLFIGVVANIDNFFMLLPEEYATGSIVIFVIGTANLINMITGSCSQIVICSPFYRFGLYFSVLLVILTITLNFWLIPIYGILGAAIATATSISLTNIIKVLFIWMKLKIQPLDIKSFYLTIIGALALSVSYLIPVVDNFYFDILIRSFSIAVMYLFLVWIFKVSIELNRSFDTLLQKIFKQ